MHIFCISSMKNWPIVSSCHAACCG